jgi:uncharacterized membrane protein YciS (DUF1049 family)
MILISLGIIIGLLLAIIVFLAVKRYQVPIERTIKQAQNFTKERGEVYIEDEGVQDLEAYLETLPKE